MFKRALGVFDDPDPSVLILLEAELVHGRGWGDWGDWGGGVFPNPAAEHADWGLGIGAIHRFPCEACAVRCLNI